MFILYFWRILRSTAKGTQSNYVKNLLGTKSTKLISGRSSIQGILDELSRGETDKVTGKVTSGGSALFSASELSAGIVSDPEAVKILTDIYDFKDEYTSRLRGTGVFRIKNVCFSLVAASNEELLWDIYDGFALMNLDPPTVYSQYMTKRRVSNAWLKFSKDWRGSVGNLK